MTDRIEAIDIRGLIRESYLIEGIDVVQCRSIFLDWALGLPDDVTPEGACQLLLSRYAPEYPDHPMTQILREGLDRYQRPRRRGGWRSRARN